MVYQSRAAELAKYILTFSLDNQVPRCPESI